VYLIGSLAHAGFSRRYSDIDMLLVTAAGLSAQALDRVRSEAVALSADWGPKVSVFWTDRNFSLGRFPPLDCIDYLDHAVVLMERESVRPARPTLQEIRHYLRGAPFADWADRARRFAVAETLKPKDHKAFLRTLLYPGRFCYSWMTGRMGSNDEAVAFLSERHPAHLDINSIARALQCRQTAADRSTIPRTNDAAVTDRCVRSASPMVAVRLVNVRYWQTDITYLTWYKFGDCVAFGANAP
jgi:hypothetical protein